MTKEELLKLADDHERMALAIVGNLHGGFDRNLTSEAADLFTIAAALRAIAEKEGE